MTNSQRPNLKYLINYKRNAIRQKKRVKIKNQVIRLLKSAYNCIHCRGATIYLRLYYKTTTVIMRFFSLLRLGLYNII